MNVSESKNVCSKTGKRKIIIKIVAMSLLVTVLLFVINDVFNYPNSSLYVMRNHTYKNLPKNSVDCVYLGSSVVDRSWAAPEAFNKYGMTVFPYSSDAMPCVLYKYAMKEAAKTQNPKLWIFDIKGFVNDPTKDGQAEKVRRVTDIWPISENKIEALNYSFNYLKQNDDFEFEPSWYLPFIKYHTRWDWTDNDVVPLSHEDFLNTSAKYMGTYASKENTALSSKQKKPIITGKPTKINKNSETVLRDFLDYLKQKNYEVLFVSSPSAIDSKDIEEYRYIFNVIKSYGFNCLDFNTNEMYSELNLDFGNDFYDSRHLNIYGMLKYTDYLSEYLNSNYDLPDRRNNENYSEWKESYEEFSEFRNEYISKLKGTWES